MNSPFLQLDISDSYNSTNIKLRLTVFNMIFVPGSSVRQYANVKNQQKQHNNNKNHKI